ncbi:MAG: 2-oxo acid dehydrogenase subunit E2 [Desulfobacterales bacterium]|nr:2-oxo acid dehydrogenase subunit E2 [Desulfobacterales bacterium]
MIKDIKIPEISENVTSGTVVAILVKVGDRVGADDPVIEFETEKAVVEIPAQVEGKIVEILVREGDQKNVGDVIAKVEIVEAEGQARAAPAPTPEPDEAKPAAEEEAPKDAAPRPPTAPEAKAEGAQTEREDQRAPAPAGPASRRLARELGVDIRQVQGSGPGGRINEADIKAHVKAAQGRPAVSVPGGAGMPRLPDFSRWGPIEMEEIGTVRRITAEGTTTSWQIIPHVTQFDEADITALEAFLQKNAAKVEKAGGKLTVTAVLMKVCALALLKFPRFNASLDLAGKKLIYKRYVHIGMMVDTSRGLLVPVIRDADAKSITALAVEIVDLAGRARNKKIKPDEMEGATFSISNQGGIGGVGFTPVILWPQAAILGVSRSATTAKFIDGAFVPRSMLPLSLSYDHRIVDGADAARFMRFICESLEQPFELYL